MKWMTSLVLLAAIGGAQSYCFNPKAESQPTPKNIDLSGMTDFGIDLYKQLSPTNSTKNFFFSPYSIWTALVLAYFGSAGNTQREMEPVLRVSDKVSAYQLLKALESFYERQQENNTLFTFNVANRAYFHQRLQLRSCMKDILSKELRTVDFSDTNGSAEKINSFVNQTTKGRISEIVTPGDLTLAVLVLVNAAFFKGSWIHQFDPSHDIQRNFSITSNSLSPLTMMSQRERFQYGESTELGARILQLPYAGDAISMVLLLPTPDRPLGTRFENMVNNLNGVKLIEGINKLSPSIVDVQLPKFKFALKIKDELKMALYNMEIRDLFNELTANMTAFGSDEIGKVDKTIHKAHVEVNHEGTVAAAATAIVFVNRITSFNPVVVNFHCNEPFIFLIYDNLQKNILFMGAIKNPSDLQTDQQ